MLEGLLLEMGSETESPGLYIYGVHRGSHFVYCHTVKYVSGDPLAEVVQRAQHANGYFVPELGSCTVMGLS